MTRVRVWAHLDEIDGEEFETETDSWQTQNLEEEAKDYALSSLNWSWEIVGVEEKK